MKVFYFISLLVLVSCNKTVEVNNPELIVSEYELVGAWENRGDSSEGLLLGHYCDSFELREDNNFAIYYWSSGSPSSDRIDGSWRVEEGNKLIFFFYDSYEISVEITSLQSNQLNFLMENGQAIDLVKI